MSGSLRGLKRDVDRLMCRRVIYIVCYARVAWEARRYVSRHLQIRLCSMFTRSFPMFTLCISVCNVIDFYAYSYLPPTLPVIRVCVLTVRLSHFCPLPHLEVKIVTLNALVSMCDILNILRVC